MGLGTQRTWALVGAGGKGVAPRMGWGLGPNLCETFFLCYCGKAFPEVLLRVALRVFLCPCVC